MDSWKNSLSNASIHLDDQTADAAFVFDSEDGGEVRRVPVHKSILIAKSDAFRPMFFGDLKQNEVKIVDASYDAFLEFLQFFYLDTVKLTIENIAEVINLTKKYQMPACTSICEKFLIKNLRQKDTFVAFTIAIKYELEDLKVHCAKLATCINLSGPEKSLLKQCTRDMLQEIIKKASLNPIEVFRFCMMWSDCACEENGLDASVMANRRTLLGDCFELIPFNDMSPRQIKTIVKAFNELFDRKDLIEIIDRFVN